MEIAHSTPGRINWWVVWTLIGAWTAIEFALLVFDYDLQARLWFLNSLLQVGWLLAGLGLSVVLAWRISKRSGSRVRGAGIGFMAGLTVTGAVLFPEFAAVQVRFWIARASYERQVRAIEADASAVKSDGVLIDAGPPVRVAFVWDGILDHWVGVVYDPTGLIMKVNETQRQKKEDARHLFGGDMIHARPLGGPWYFCGAT